MTGHNTIVKLAPKVQMNSEYIHIIKEAAKTIQRESGFMNVKIEINVSLNKEPKINITYYDV